MGKYHAAVATARNVFCAYDGGLKSRAGTALVGRCKQTPPAAPPRDIPFLFSLSQGYALEFGDNYMRVKSAGEYALEPALAVTAATRANPIEVTADAFAITAATPNNGGVIGSYAPGDDITLAGGSYVTPAILAVTNTQLAALSLGSPGGGVYAPADTIVPAGGVQSTPAQLTVASTQVLGAAIVNGGSGGTTGTHIVTGTTGTGTKFQASVTIAGGAITAINSITVAGAYTVNPTAPSAEPVTGASLSGATLNLVIGILTFTITADGVFNANPVGGNFTQGSTSGNGTGATFISAIMAPHALTVSQPGVYITVPANPVSQASTTGDGAGATFNLSSTATGGFNNGDWVYFAGIGGMTQLNQNTYIVAGVSGATFTLTDLDGNPINSTAYGAFTAGGSVARLYTLTTPYAAVDLPYLKFTQDTDTMSLTCVNLVSMVEYQSQELKRFGATDWTIAPLDLGATISPPSVVAAIASNNPNSGSTPPTQPCAYAYVVTTVNLTTGQESIASEIANVTNSVDMGVTAGSITVQWTQVASPDGAPIAYNIYRTAPAYNTSGSTTNALPVPVGSAFYFCGSSYGNQFVDTNTVTDANKTPPLHLDPFAPGQVPNVTVTSSSNDWTIADVTINSVSGSGWVGIPVILGGQIAAVIVQDPGQGYTKADTLVFSGGGTSATGTLNVGPQSGTNPAVVAYFQTRRIYAQTLNQPDTFFGSQSDNFTDFDASNPPSATDAITASPFSQAVNGIQWLIPMPGGLVMLAGDGAWQLTGTGGSAFSPVAITPDSLQATPQAFNGSDSICPPIRVNYDIIFLSSTGQFFYELNYNIYFNIYNVIDISWTSGHLFLGQKITQDAWCLQPYKLLWGLRADGVLLSLTWLKEQEISGWTRHDTQGIFQGVCTVTEPPVDALYLIVQRYVQNRWLYFSERMDNRIWESGEDEWCVDCGLSTLNSSAYPAAVLTAAAASGAGVVLSASTAVFAAGNVGNIIRAGGGIATITGYTDAEHVIVTWTRPLSQTIPGDPSNTPLPIASGDWSMLPQVNEVIGLMHLAGKQVVGLADGIPFGASAQYKPLWPGPYTVSATGTLTLPFTASLVTVGLAFLPQIQSLYLDEGQPTGQMARKSIVNASARLSASAWPYVLSNQPDGSSLDPRQIAPTWAPGQQMKPTPPGQQTPSPPYQTAAGQSAQPLTTGDVYSNVASSFRKPGQIALQQPNPQSLNVVAFVINDLRGDLPEETITPSQRGGQQQQPQRRAA